MALSAHIRIAARSRRSGRRQIGEASGLRVEQSGGTANLLMGVYVMAYGKYGRW